MKGLIRGIVAGMVALTVQPTVVHDDSEDLKILPENAVIYLSRWQADYNDLINENEIDCKEYDWHDLVSLACNIYHEARGEPDAGRRMVAEVTLNRVNANHYPQTVSDVVWQLYQFSWTLDKNKPPMRGRMKKLSLDLALEYMVLFQNQQQYTEDMKITHYHADSVRPTWSYQDARLTKEFQVGAHIFYSER